MPRINCNIPLDLSLGASLRTLIIDFDGIQLRIGIASEAHIIQTFFFVVVVVVVVGRLPTANNSFL